MKLRQYLRDVLSRELWETFVYNLGVAVREWRTRKLAESKCKAWRMYWGL